MIRTYIVLMNDSRVNACMDLYHDPDEVDVGEGVDSVLDRREVAHDGVPIDDKRVRGEELVPRGGEDRMIEAAHECDPPHELAFRGLINRRVRRRQGSSAGVGSRARAQALGMGHCGGHMME